MNFKLDLVQQAYFCELAPEALAPVPGGWGRMGYTRCDLKKINAALFSKVLRVAHAAANAPKAKKAPRVAPAKSAKKPLKAGKKARSARR